MMDVKGSTSGVKDIHASHKEWDDICCPICMDHPHNAVLIICSSHEKGCRSYICDTSYRHSNCLDRFKKLKANESDSNPSLLGSSLNDADTGLPGNLAETSENYNRNVGAHERNAGSSARTLEQENSNSNNNNEGEEVSLFSQSSGGGRGNDNELKCPLCRGSVIGWIIVKEARQYLDLKTRSCSRESCSFSGNYRELRRHARRVHPATRPSDVDPSRQRAWHRLEHQTEYGDVLSAIGASPGAIMLGDYVIDNVGDEGISNSRRNLWTTLFLFQMMGNPIRPSLEQEQARGFPSSSSRSWRTHRRPSAGHHRSLLGLRDNNEDDGYLDDDRPIPRRRRRFTRSRPDDRRS